MSKDNEPSPSGPGQGPRDREDFLVLIVDDEPDVRDILGFELAAAGLNYVEAGSGKEALQVIKGKKIAAIISDIRMPNGDGLEMLASLRTTEPVVPPVIFVSGHTDYRLEELYEQGAEALFAKPVNIPALIEVLLAMIGPQDERWSRRYKRIATKVLVDVDLLDIGTASGTYIKNVGRGGMFLALAAEHLPAVGVTLDFTVRFRDRRFPPIAGTGIVRWARIQSNEDSPSGIGLEFVDLDASSRRWLVELLNDLTTKTYIPQN